MRYLILFLFFLVNVCFAEVNYVAAGASQVILNSADGITWNYVSLSKQFANKDFTGVTYGNNLWVAVGTYGAIATSVDGNTWENHSIQTTTYLSFRSVVYYHNVFYASSDYSIYQSLDGKIWTKTVDNIGFTITRLMIANGKLFGLGFGNVFQFNGLGWAVIYKGSGTFRSIAYGNGIYLITSQDGTYTLTSNNGVNWISTTNNASEPYKPEGMSSIFAGNIFVAANHWGETSTNGLSWNYKAVKVDGVVTSKFQFLKMIFDGQKYIAAGMNIGSSGMLLSTDAINWYTVQFSEKIPGYALNDVYFKN